MPSGQTHDRITWIGFPLVSAGTLALTQAWDLAIATGSCFLFSGLMFGPDLDIVSRQYRRWGYLRWIWLPYQRRLRHRSWLSHGPVIGTVLRVLYLGGWGFGLLMLVAVFWAIAQGQSWNRYLVWVRPAWTLSPSLLNRLMAMFLGLELGAMSHSLSDWLVSGWKRLTHSKK
ncbi:metal-binding protein [Lyngbya confervoides]|uniref:Metal-binding protein n=1 Tax=Lyngbya confervoides BDU141951 TaxID=1574623 RepID=A0ABD4T5U1_9CYAN|nr:metal-binding protein [Lyngbya confervoides]MCM1984063.1 metal-binding protein [Lyngbya confervoides BDU141951]